MVNKCYGMFSKTDYQHRRYNPLLDEWIIVSPHRMKRPWKGHIEKESTDEQVSLNDNKNPLKPGGERPNGIVNPFYTRTFIFENDFPAIMDDQNKLQKIELDVVGNKNDDLFQCEEAKGKCYVMCFDPDSKVTLATMTHDNIVKVIEKLIELSLQLQKSYDWIQIFENKGAIMGCSNPHPHCQIWASSFLPTEPSKKDKMQKLYYEKNKKNLLIEYLNKELNAKVRVVIETKMWVCLVPFWAVWPYETYLIPKRHCLRLQELNSDEIEDLSTILKKLLCKYDNLFKTSFPYSMGWHGAPTGKYLNSSNNEDLNAIATTDSCFHWQLHAVFLPPLLRSPTVKKFMVGYEMLGEPQRDITAEKAAEILRDLSDVHYKEQE